MSAWYEKMYGTPSDEANKIHNIDGWQVTMPAHWQLLVDAQAMPPQYIFQEPYGRLLVCVSSCTFQDASASGVPAPSMLELLFSTACEQMGMQPAVTQLGSTNLAALQNYYPTEPGLSTLAYRGLTRDGDSMVGFGIFAPGAMLMVYFIGADSSDFGGEDVDYFAYVRLIRRFID